MEKFIDKENMIALLNEIERVEIEYYQHLAKYGSKGMMAVIKQKYCSSEESTQKHKGRYSLVIKTKKFYSKNSELKQEHYEKANGVPIEMVFVRGGYYLMGDNKFWMLNRTELS